MLQCATGELAVRAGLIAFCTRDWMMARLAGEATDENAGMLEGGPLESWRWLPVSQPSSKTNSLKQEIEILAEVNTVDLTNALQDGDAEFVPRSEELIIKGNFSPNDMARCFREE